MCQKMGNLNSNLNARRRNMIGLIDLDFQLTPGIQLRPPNIEIMKLASYYKTEECKFCRLVSLNEANIDGYSDIYLFSEFNHYTEIPANILQIPQLQFGGTAFTNQEYVPFNNSIIDTMIPRTFIYKEFLQRKYNDGAKTKDVAHILDDSYYRITDGKQILPIPPIKRGKRFFIYDRNIFVPDWQKILNDIVEHSPSAVLFIHPQYCKTLDDYFYLRNATRISRTNTIILDLNCSLLDYTKIIKKFSNLFLADVQKSSQVCLSLGGNFDNVFQYYKDYIYKMNILYLFWAANIYIKIYYQEPKIGFKDPLAHLSQMTANWTNQSCINRTLIDRITIKDKKKINLPMEEKQQLIKFYSTAESLFHQTYTELKNRRLWRI